MGHDTASPLHVIACEPPSFSAAAALEIAATHYGLTARATPIVSERDQNFRLDTADGRTCVLKIANAAEDPTVTGFQVAALEHLARKPALQLPVPCILPTLDGKPLFELTAGTVRHRVRVVSWLDGVPLRAEHFSAPLCRTFGAGLASLASALADFDYPAVSQSLLWDMRHAPALRDLLPHIRSTRVREQAAGSLDDFERNVLPGYTALRTQVVHNDANPGNVLIDTDNPGRIVGLIDFGDMQRAPLVADLAIAASYLRELSGDPLVWIAELVAGYHAGLRLTDDEVDLLYDLINTRLATTVAILEWRVAARGADDAYLVAATDNEASAAEFLLRLRELPRAHVTQLLRQVCASVC